MRSLFWRILATFWLGIALVAGLSLLLGRALNQDAWILSLHPGLDDLDSKWVKRYEQQGPAAAQDFLEQRKRKYRIDTQVLGESGQQLVKGTFPSRAAAFEARHGDDRRLPWRRLTAEYTSPESGESYLFIYRIPHPELAAWHRGSLFWPLSAIAIALVVLTLFSLMLTLSITRPLDRLRGAVHDLGQTAYQQNSLARLATRRDELGLLAKDFNRMGERLQGLIGSQRQLLRDVSHELRSPLARLRIALALAERADAAERERLWPRLSQECDRLEALISEILALARLDAGRAPHNRRSGRPARQPAGRRAPDRPATTAADRSRPARTPGRLARHAGARAGQSATQCLALQPSGSTCPHQRAKPGAKRNAERARPWPWSCQRIPGAIG